MLTRSLIHRRGKGLSLPLFLLATISCGGATKDSKPTKTPVSSQVEKPDTNLAAKGLPELIASPLADDPMAVTIHRLSNGMTVYISTDRSQPSVSSWLAVRAGSRHDPADSTGLAHYLEHMLFKGSAKLGTLDFAKEKPLIEEIAGLYDQLREAKDPAARGKILETIDATTQKASQYAVPNELDNLYASMGVTGVNAFTSDEQTVYISTVPSNRFSDWLEVEGDRFSNPQFRLFYPELESVYEEKNRSLDNPQSRMYHALAREMFKKHPYGTQTTIGEAEHLKNPAYADMSAYFETWYRPNNMAIVLAGDIDAKTAIPLLEKAFGGLEPKALPELPPSDPQGPTERREVEIVAPGEQSVMLAWSTAKAGAPDSAALKAMDLVVDNSATGLLNLDLVLSQKLPQAGSFGEQMKEAGYWILTGTAREGQSLDDVEKLLIEVVDKLKAGNFTQEDLNAIVTNSEIYDKRRLESNDARVEKMSQSFIVGQEWKEIVNEAQALRKVSREDIMRVANQYLGDNRVVVKRINGEFKAPKVDKPKISAIKIDASKQSDFGRSIRNKAVSPLQPQWLKSGEHYQVTDLSAGPLISVKNQRNDLFAIDYEFDLGSLTSPLLCFATKYFEKTGYADKSAKALQKELYALGSTIDFGCSHRSMSISLTGLDRNMEASVALLKAWLAAPKANDAQTFEKLLANILSKRSDQEKDPRTLSSALTQYALLGKNSPYVKVASNRQLKAAKPAQLLKLVSDLPNFKHRSSYFGPRDASALGEAIALGAGKKKTPAMPSIRYQRVKKPTLFALDQKIAQAQINAIFPSKASKESEAVPAMLLNQYLGGGMGGLIFQEIREARGLAYSAWTVFVDSDKKADDSMLVAGLGTQADKSVDAIGTLLPLINPLKVDSERFKTAKTSVEANFRNERILPRDRAASVYAWQDQGHASDPRPARFEALSSAKPEDVQNFAALLTKVAPIITLFGDSTRIDMAAFSKAAATKSKKTIKAKSLFGH